MVLAGALVAAAVGLVLGFLLARYPGHLLRHAQPRLLDDLSTGSW